MESSPKGPTIRSFEVWFATSMNKLLNYHSICGHFRRRDVYETSMQSPMYARDRFWKIHTNMKLDMSIGQA